MQKVASDFIYSHLLFTGLDLIIYVSVEVLPY